MEKEKLYTTSIGEIPVIYINRRIPIPIHESVIEGQPFGGLRLTETDPQSEKLMNFLKELLSKNKEKL